MNGNSPNLFAGMKKHERLITRIMDIFLIGIILFGAVIMLPVVVDLLDTEKDPYLREADRLYSVPALLLFLFVFFSLSMFLVSLLSAFQKNITARKRSLLAVFSILPILMFFLYLSVGSHEKLQRDLTLLPLYVWPVWFINFAPIFFSKPFPDFFTSLANRIVRSLHQLITRNNA